MLSHDLWLYQVIQIHGIHVLMEIATQNNGYLFNCYLYSLCVNQIWLLSSFWFWLLSLLRPSTSIKLVNDLRADSIQHFLRENTQ